MIDIFARARAFALLEQEARDAAKGRADKYLSQRLLKKRLGQKPSDLPPLTQEIAFEKGVGDYSIDEIIRTFNVSRSTAYRWKKSNFHVPKEDVISRNGKVMHIRSENVPYNLNLQVSRQALSTFRWARGQIDPRDPITRECYEAIEQLAKEAADLASEWDVEHNFSHFFDDDWEEESPQTPRT